MESILSFICVHAHQAYWIIFILLLLGGLNLPTSEDLLIAGGGAIASSCIPDHALQLYFWILAGCYISAWISYWLARILGPKLYSFRLFSSIITHDRLMWIRHFYAKWGILTFIVGRFCPGGIRNALFFSSGLTKMPFNLFVLRDGIAALISTTVLFRIGYAFGENRALLYHYLHRYTEVVLIVLIIAIAIAFAIYRYRKNRPLA